MASYEARARAAAAGSVPEPASALARFRLPRTATASTPAARRVDIPNFLRIDLLLLGGGG
ncbi:hypothetical protein GCM10009804_55490 [Kribbella hippodromi]|uniref:Uncharacterized protein n=1 Tax=Kribbella hippodromi TaxID=434347 RepID=A0ABP4PXQ0_9ACTN